MLYSKSTNGFYLREVHGENTPSDAIEISDELYNTLLLGINNGGTVIIDSNGQPVLVPRSDADTALYNSNVVRAQRDQLLSNTDWTELPSVQALHASDPTWAASWATYRQALRDITTQPGFPGTVTWPTAPV
jgi:hypothetical protein